MLTGTGVENGKGDEEKRKLKNEWLSQFVITFGTDDGGQTSTFNGSIPQTLMMFNGDMIRRATGGDKGTVLDVVANHPRLNANDKVAYLYLAGLSRRPTNAEMAALTNSINAMQRNSLAPLQDVWWAILNSNEFILNH
jgi:hypothetical protein